MLTGTAKKKLEEQGYRVVGRHSAVKTCGWTRKMLRGEGGCYKLKFYGIMSHQCMQMTTSISCANRCSFCWRDYKAPVSREWKWKADKAEDVLKQSIKAHHKLLSGFGGNKKTPTPLFEGSKKVKHAALSLTGEPIIYPQINELIDKFHKEGISTFLVTNAQYPEQIRDLKEITQLYISIDAPNKELLKKIDIPLFKNYWERLMQSLEYTAKKKSRTCIRITAIKNVNMIEPEKYAKLIQKANADFVEIKAYMFLGASRQRLKEENMPLHEEVVEWSKKIAEHLPEYGIVAEHIPSRVVMLARKKFRKGGKWHTWINFQKFIELVNNGEELASTEFTRKTPQTGISGKGTEWLRELRNKGLPQPLPTATTANEDTEETELE